MTTITEAIAAFPREPYDSFKYPAEYAQELLLTHPEWVPQECRDHAKEEFDTPLNARGAPRRRSPGDKIILWHAFRFWCKAQGWDLGEATRLLANEYLARSGIEVPAHTARQV
ncbi:hypothetical protein ACFCX4_09000 [Kitasatospora sp. NPDC056327]|uniref:hypothetical protein n=1 Tax=Kitasatospora sp. NPDC056327 TaxID=3345785 RepID=UPI0035D71DD8